MTRRCFENLPAFILADGPSLPEDLSPLAGALTIGVNIGDEYGCTFDCPTVEAGVRVAQLLGCRPICLLGVYAFDHGIIPLLVDGCWLWNYQGETFRILATKTARPIQDQEAMRKIMAEILDVNHR